MIQIETLSGQPYDTVYLNETDSKYSDIRKHIKRPDYPEYNSYNFKKYTMYVKTDIKLFNKGKLINFDDYISFDKEDCVLQIFIKYEYIFCDFWNKIYNFTGENIYENLVDLIKIDGPFINLLREEEQTEEICKSAVQQNGLSLKDVKIEQTEELCKLAVQKYGCALEYVKNQTEEICKLAVQEDGEALEFVEEQTEEICKLAIEQDSSSLQYIKDQTEEICKYAIDKNYSALLHIKEPTFEIYKYAKMVWHWNM